MTGVKPQHEGANGSPLSSRLWKNGHVRRPVTPPPSTSSVCSGLRFWRTRLACITPTFLTRSAGEGVFKVIPIFQATPFDSQGCKDQIRDRPRKPGSTNPVPGAGGGATKDSTSETRAIPSSLPSSNPFPAFTRRVSHFRSLTSVQASQSKPSTSSVERELTLTDDSRLGSKRFGYPVALRGGLPQPVAGRPLSHSRSGRQSALFDAQRQAKVWLGARYFATLVRHPPTPLPHASAYRSRL